MRYVLVIFLLLTCISCATDTEKGTPEPLFAIPTLIEDPNTEVQSEPLVPQPDPVVPVVAPIVDEPEPELVFDIFGPKLIESIGANGNRKIKISDGARDVDIHLDTITLTFDEDVAKSNVQIHKNHSTFRQSLRWKRIVSGKKVVLTPLGNVINLKTDGQYEISGDVEDAARNMRTILITFTTKKGDNRAPQMTRSSVRHGGTNVPINTERFVFDFDEAIHRADVKLYNRTRQIDMKWKMLIDDKRIILLRLPGEGLRLRHKERYRVQLRWADAAGNWEPADWGIIRIFDFTTEAKK
ncbi:hypothetical protein C6499_22565 [Candidatus Poribacteria bacterium]|nr:MAG: hypothetical protein C6499_22565 [Candidatus Poribacteria bacterium]